ncbi:SAM-dependent methyltransferase [Mycolicibacterium moriokaense]|jgi:methyltransferase (TIGR00027 family)|uniref:S-adenosyl-L-methionine-dependent methyltransferase n=1 Tax=Mycolicibacterium moriokaense TaxID=39691 RepID=A0AAD1HFI0_9MYCO|nr:class I SAM-dependent methyltransferase [Mycolicibacterium moriokaense]MCV7041376.1 class I SAM-dependent methyltransferase [Mycolicibacterium moriokaense]ORB19402.1 SAM-dependent methyltransferase [Mycolicibacterium moriokaense]BBX04432.1 putative S-adenosyl-L-methionine-dependent methyltransferase [Mycolicibacterium moriokaense]
MSTDSRTDGDSWDLASSVGTTATMVAAARAVSSREHNALFDDPYAAPLVRAVGLEFFTRLVDGEVELPDDAEPGGPAFLATSIAVRTRFFDDFFKDACAAGVRQAVILASGLDSRAYRLPWSDGTIVYEIDQPRVIEFKTATMTSIGARPAAEHRTVGIDLREDWPKALRDSGFDVNQPTAWSAEGLLVYLPPEAQDRLFDNITALSAPGSQLATEYHPDAAASIGSRMKAIKAQLDDAPDLDITQLFYDGERNGVVEYLTERGWHVSARRRPDVFAGYGREFPDTEALVPLRDSLAVIATRK